MTSPKIVAVFSAFLCFLTIDAIVVKQENSLFGPYEAGLGHLVWWDLSGSAQLAETAIRLTPDEPGKQGAIWNNYQVLANDWEFHLQFHVHGKGIHLNGNGLAFWYVRDPLHAGPVFGSKDYYSGLGIFIDTFENPETPHNHKHPYLSAVVNNGSFPYYHGVDGTAGQVGGCHLPGRNQEWPTKIAITYISNVLTIFMDTQGTDTWAHCFTANGIYLPTGYYFGVTASTGEYSDNHDVVSITTLDNILPDKPWEDRSYVIPTAEFLQVPLVPYQQEHYQPQASEEELQRVEEKREAPEIIAETYEHVQPEVHVHHEAKPEVKAEAQPKAKAEAATPVSFLRKATYIFGIVVFLIVAYSMFKKYNTQRKERMQKRLY